MNRIVFWFYAIPFLSLRHVVLSILHQRDQNLTSALWTIQNSSVQEMLRNDSEKIASKQFCRNSNVKNDDFFNFGLQYATHHVYLVSCVLWLHWKYAHEKNRKRFSILCFKFIQQLMIEASKKNVNFEMLWTMKNEKLTNGHVTKLIINISWEVSENFTKLLGIFQHTTS